MPKDKLTYDRLSRIVDAPMAMRPEALRALATRIVAFDDFEEPPELQAALCEAQPTAVVEAKVPKLPKTGGAIAIVPINGGVAQHRGSDYWGGVFTEELVNVLRTLTDMPNVGATVLSFDSPGGIVFGVEEAANSIRELSQAKPIYGHVKAQAASAAYWLGASTTKLFAQPSSEVGSIGVWTMHINAEEALKKFGVEISMVHAGEYKVEGNPFGPLDEEARNEMQRSVDKYYRDFLEGVAAGRNVSRATVEADFGKGRMIEASRAKSLGMIDGVATMDELLAGIMKPAESSRRSRAKSIAIAKAWEPEMY